MEMTSNFLVQESNEQLQHVLENCINLYDEPSSEFLQLDYPLFNQIIDSISRDEQDRLITPILWDPEVQHLLSKNCNLAHKVLRLIICRLNNNEDALFQYDAAIKEQLKVVYYL